MALWIQTEILIITIAKWKGRPVITNLNWLRESLGLIELLGDLNYFYIKLIFRLFYGECEEREETDSNLETGSGFGRNRIHNINVNSVDNNSGLFGINTNPLNRITCDHMNCQFGAKCKYNIEGVPHCECRVRNNFKH